MSWPTCDGHPRGRVKRDGCYGKNKQFVRWKCMGGDGDRPHLIRRQQRDVCLHGPVRVYEPGHDRRGLEVLVQEGRQAIHATGLGEAVAVDESQVAPARLHGADVAGLGEAEVVALREHADVRPLPCDGFGGTVIRAVVHDDDLDVRSAGRAAATPRTPVCWRACCRTR